MGFHAVEWAFSQSLPSGPKFALVALAKFADDATGECYAGQETIARLIGRRRQRVVEYMAELEEHGYITRKRRAKEGGARTSDLTTLNLSANVRKPDVRKADVRKPYVRESTSQRPENTRPTSGNRTGIVSEYPGNSQKQPARAREGDLAELSDDELPKFLAYHGARNSGFITWAKREGVYGEKVREFRAAAAAPKRSTTDDRVHQGLELARRLAEQEEAAGGAAASLSLEASSPAGAIGGWS